MRFLPALVILGIIRFEHLHSDKASLFALLLRLRTLGNHTLPSGFDTAGRLARGMRLPRGTKGRRGQRALPCIVRPRKRLAGKVPDQA